MIGFKEATHEALTVYRAVHLIGHRITESFQSFFPSEAPIRLGYVGLALSGLVSLSLTSSVVQLALLVVLRHCVEGREEPTHVTVAHPRYVTQMVAVITLSGASTYQLYGARVLVQVTVRSPTPRMALIAREKVSKPSVLS
jgi:hypothetical protein